MKRIVVLAVVCVMALFAAGCQVVTSGNYSLRRGQTLSGDLTITGGNSTLEQGSLVTGSVLITGGTVNSNGQIERDVSVTGGSVNFGPSAVVRGVVQETGGSVRIAEGASVRSTGSTTVGNPGLRFGNVFLGFIFLPIALLVAFLVLVTMRTGRTASPQASAVQTAGDAQPSSIQPFPQGQRGMGLGGSIVAGVILIGLGILFLLQEFLSVDIWQYAWPFLIIVAGLLCFAAMFLGGKNAGGLAIPGCILTGLGLLFLVQNAFDLFQTWAYAWALIIPTIGVGHFIQGWWSDRPALRARGIHLIWSGLIIFVLLAAFFELVVNLSGFFWGDLGRFAFPALLILVGVLLLFSRFLNWSAPKPAMQLPAGTGPTTLKKD